MTVVLRFLIIGVAWLISILATWFLSALIHSDTVGWNYVEDSFHQLSNERSAMREYALERLFHSTDRETLVFLADQRSVDMFVKYGDWQNSTIGLVRFNDKGELVDQCFSDLDDDMTCADEVLLNEPAKVDP